MARKIDRRGGGAGGEEIKIMIIMVKTVNVGTVQPRD